MVPEDWSWRIHLQKACFARVSKRAALTCACTRCSTHVQRNQHNDHSQGVEEKTADAARTPRHFAVQSRAKPLMVHAQARATRGVEAGWKDRVIQMALL